MYGSMSVMTCIENGIWYAFGKPLPFGPFLAVGSLIWAFGGWKLWAWYMDFLGPLWMP